MRITASWPSFVLEKRQTTWRRAVRAALILTLIRALVLPLPAFAAESSGPLIARLADGVALSVDGRVLRDQADGVTLATIAGAALLSPAMPVTAGPRLARASSAPPGARIRILATGYSSTPDQTDATPFITASGTPVHDGTVAVNFLPFGTKVRFLDYRPGMVFTVEDRHSPRLSDRADIWFPSREAALLFGKRVLRMEVVNS